MTRINEIILTLLRESKVSEIEAIAIVAAILYLKREEHNINLRTQDFCIQYGEFTQRAINNLAR